MSTKVSVKRTVTKTKPTVREVDSVEKKDDWEYRDRMYVIAKGSPVSYQLRTQHSPRKPLQFNDGTRLRALRYAQNHDSPFIDEQNGEVMLGRIRFENGSLFVKKEDVNLQKFLSIYHSDFNTEYYELDLEKDAQDDLVHIQKESEATQLALSMDINDLEGVARAVFRSNVNNMRSSEIRRDTVIFAKNNPSEFIKLANDENIKNRNLAIKSVEMGILHVLSDNATVCWNDKEKTKIMTAPFGENVYSALSRFFKTDEGLEVMQGIINRL